jgi:hypothetical protein
MNPCPCGYFGDLKRECPASFKFSVIASVSPVHYSIVSISALNCLLYVAAITFSGCNHSGSKISGPLPQRGYLWQREWTPAVIEALKETQTRMDGIVLLGAEIDWIGKKAEVVRAAINWRTVKREANPCSIALRVAPFSGSYSVGDVRIKSVVDVAKSLVEDARKHGVNVKEFQLDFDAAQEDLANYREWLRILCSAIRPVRFVITALPAWLDEPTFVSLVREVDGYVLQVHSVALRNGESTTLCDSRLARMWVEKAAQLRLPFSVALPTYRCSAGYDAAGKLLGVAMDSVQPAWPPNTRVLEFASDADEIAALVNDWRQARPRELRELIWYRVPIATDARNWRWATLSAAMAGRKPLHKLSVVQEGENPIDVAIMNEGEADEQLDSVVTVTWSGQTLVAADALAGWIVGLARERAILTIADGHHMRLPPGAVRKIGWLRYDQPTNLRLILAKQDEASR